MDFMTDVREILMEGSVAYLCTSAKGNPHLTPLFYIYDPFEDHLYFFTPKKTKKFRNIETNPRVSLTVDVRDEANPFRNKGVMVRGRAEIVETEKLSDFLVGLYRNFKHKYMSFIVVKSESLEQVLVRIVPCKFSFWRGSEFHRLQLRVCRYCEDYGICNR